MFEVRFEFEKGDNFERPKTKEENDVVNKKVTNAIMQNMHDNENDNKLLSVFILPSSYKEECKYLKCTAFFA